jgi:UDP-glucose 6-dehydrogenase
MRDAPSIAIAQTLADAGVQVVGYDRKAWSRPPR